MGHMAQSVHLPRPARIRGLRSVQAPERPVAQSEEITMTRKTSPVRQPSSQAESVSTITNTQAFSNSRSSRASGATRPPAVPKPAVTKTQQVIRLLKRKAGVSIEELQEVTGWQAHSIRGLLSGALPNRHGFNIESSVDGDGTRRYRIKAEGR